MYPQRWTPSIGGTYLVPGQGPCRYRIFIGSPPNFRRHLPRPRGTANHNGFVNQQPKSCKAPAKPKEGLPLQPLQPSGPGDKMCSPRGRGSKQQRFRAPSGGEHCQGKEEYGRECNGNCVIQTGRKQPGGNRQAIPKPVMLREIFLASGAFRLLVGNHYSLNRSMPREVRVACRWATFSWRGVQWVWAHRAAAMPTAWPMAMQMDMTR